MFSNYRNKISKLEKEIILYSNTSNLGLEEENKKLKENLQNYDKHTKMLSDLIKTYTAEKEKITQKINESKELLIGIDKIENSPNSEFSKNFKISKNSQHFLLSDPILLKNLLELPIFLKTIENYENLINGYIHNSDYVKLELIFNLILSNKELF